MDAASNTAVAAGTAPIDPLVLRQVCGRFLTGVAIVTSSLDDAPVGVTINSFTSVSLTPPLVLFCIHHGSALVPALDDCDYFAINVLAADQSSLAGRFARRSTASFAALRTWRATTGAVLLSDAIAYLECRVAARHDGGDHLIVIGEVIDLGVLRDTHPLAFFRSGHPRFEVSP
ncbi:hypothetical protein GCM10010172_19330 [Paractinoplanes ferrugineus]|uniref:Flavin reductase like domain-containing protein n=1 Tax=Paractinoplanes ferrugineus TaxID=113564 RepID=A0A919JFH1_9ACTN|nr:flavin reductase family protein [Actinoplanes ferrugineus]GIE16236.1 hypothetical protein Afe05nite_80760 [Actinoplanes ferrugineus]